MWQGLGARARIAVPRGRWQWRCGNSAGGQSTSLARDSRFSERSRRGPLNLHTSKKVHRDFTSYRRDLNPLVTPLNQAALWKFTRSAHFTRQVFSGILSLSYPFPFIREKKQINRWNKKTQPTEQKNRLSTNPINLTAIGVTQPREMSWKNQVRGTWEGSRLLR